MAGDFTTGEEADQRHVAERVAHDLQLRARSAEMRPAAPRAADVDGAGDATLQTRSRRLARRGGASPSRSR
jgi:hypothetical protein